jgi:hypothetical protein
MGSEKPSGRGKLIVTVGARLVGPRSQSCRPDRTTLLDCCDNAPKLAGDGFSDRLERRISNVFHGYCRVDGGDFDLAASDVLHDHVARKHGSDLVVRGQRLMGQRRIAGAEDPIISEIDVEFFLHRCFDIDFGQNAKSLGFERLDDAFYDGAEVSTHGLCDIVLHLNTLRDWDHGKQCPAISRTLDLIISKMRPYRLVCAERAVHELRRRNATKAIPKMAKASTSTLIPPKPPIP